MKRIAILLTLCLLSNSVQASDDPSEIYGFWATEDNGRIEIRPCANNVGTLCGIIHDADTDAASLKRNGHVLLEEFIYSGDRSWKKGLIHDPEGGGTYNGKLYLLDKDTVKLKGCAWIFCGSKIWTRIHEEESRMR